MSHLYSDLPLKVFGCVAFVHVHHHTRDKLDLRAVKCVFLGYSLTKKGYKCFESHTKHFLCLRMSHSLNQKNFTTPLLRESKLEDSIFDLDSENVDKTEGFVIDTPHVVSELNLDTTTQVDDDTLFGQV